MPDRSEWSPGEPRGLTLDEAVHTLRARAASGAAPATGPDAPVVRLETGPLGGPPPAVALEEGMPTLARDGLPWKGFLARLGLPCRRRSADVPLAVPADVRAGSGVAGTGAVATGAGRRTDLGGITGSATPAGLVEAAGAATVSGAIAPLRRPPAEGGPGGHADPGSPGSPGSTAPLDVLSLRKDV